MKTVENKLTEMLVQNGMFESQAKEVMTIAKKKIGDLVEDYNISWNSPSHEYPQAVYDVLFIDIKNTALEWIEENMPLAWYKPMFETKA